MTTTTRRISEQQIQQAANASMTELEHWKTKLMFQYPFAGYDSGLILVPNNSPSVAGGSGRASSSIQIQADDFAVKKIYGFAYGPVNALGLTILSAAGAAATDFPNPINPVLAVRGISVKASDNKTGRNWMNNPIPVELITPKGYANQTNGQFEFEWLLPGNSTVQLEWTNQDTKVNPADGTLMYHAVFLMLYGERYNGLRVN